MIDAIAWSRGSFLRITGMPQLTRRVGIIFPVLLAFGCVCVGQTYGQALQGDTPQNTVRGTVINAVTHEPIVRALVSSPGERLAMLTDGEGRFEFTLPKGGSESAGNPGAPGTPRRTSGAGGPLWLTARKPGFLDRPNEAGQVQAIPGNDAMISLIPEALIKGRVILSTGEAAQGIDVQIFTRQVQEGIGRWVRGGQVRTNSNGEFRFAELSPGGYKVATREMMDNDPAETVPGGQLYGFAPVYYPGIADFALAGTIQLTAGQMVEADISVARQPYYPVKIPVAAGEHNGGMSISVSVQGHPSPGYSLGYNAGKQTIQGLLPNGNYLVEAATSEQNGATGAVNIAVTGAAVEGRVMALLRNSSIRLQVTEEFSDTSRGSSGSWSDGQHTYSLHGPRAYLQARVDSADDFAPPRGGSLRSPMGPGDDSLVIEGLAPGRYWLRLTSSRGYVAAASMGGVDLLHQPFVVVPGPTTPIEITMRDDSAEIEGAVTGVPSQSPLNGGNGAGGGSGPSAWVYCVPLPDSGGQFQQLSANSDGKFNSQRMMPGTYRVMAFKSPLGNFAYRDVEAMRAYDSNGQVVHLAGGQKVSVQLQLNSSE
jgi:hypothetical protein